MTTRGTDADVELGSSLHTSDEDAATRPRPRNVRRRSPRLTFGADNCVEGWAFKVHRAFRPALDIIYTSRLRSEKGANGTAVKRTIQEWTEGDPPAYGFRAGDLLPSREPVEGFIAPSPDAAPLSRWVIQIGKAESDTVKDKHIAPGRVTFRLYEWQGGQTGKYVELGWHNCTQADFVAALLHGPQTILTRLRSSHDDT